MQHNLNSKPSIGHNSRNIKEDKAFILSMFADLAEQPDELVKYLQHVGFDFEALTDPKQLPEAIVAHYRTRQGQYDIEKASQDLLTWPPISSRIFELQEAQKSNQAGG